MDDDMIIDDTLQPPTTLAQEEITLESGAEGEKHQDDNDIPIPPTTPPALDYPELDPVDPSIENEGLPQINTTTITSTTLDGHPGQHDGSIAPSGELDLEMNMNIKRALQRVIEGFDDEHDEHDHHDHHHDPSQNAGGVEGPGDMSATLQQQEEYMRRNGARLGQDEMDDGSGLHHHHHHHHHDDDDEHEHDPRDNDGLGDVTLEGDRDNIFQHFTSIGLPHPTHPHPHSQTSTPQPGSPSTSKPSGPAGNNNTATPNSTRGSKRKRPAKIKGPIPPVDDDPSRPLTEEEIKRRQNRSRASGRVLAVSHEILIFALGHVLICMFPWISRIERKRL